MQLADREIRLVYDSKDDLEAISKAQLIDRWNSDLVNLNNGSWDSRSDNKGKICRGSWVNRVLLITLQVTQAGFAWMSTWSSLHLQSFLCNCEHHKKCGKVQSLSSPLCLGCCC